MIEQHLTAIRTQFPIVANIRYDRKWIVSELTVNDLKMSVDDCVEVINDSEYGPVSNTELMYGKYQIFRFQMIFNPEKLAPIISKLCDASAEANELSGWDAESLHLDFLSEAESMYTFSKGYGDCPSGCMYQHVWQFRVTPNGVTLDNEWETGDKSLDGLY